jgi:cytoskeletal protein RodZ
MTRTDVMASSRPRTVGAAPSNRRPSSVARLLALPAALLLALALLLPGTAMADATSGYSQTPTTTTYSQTPTTPSTTTTTTPSTTTTPKTGTLPSKEAEEPTKTTPAAETEPEKTSTTPTTSTQASTLPFTGFNLSWDIGFGLVLIAAGFSILAIQRRQRRGAEH